MRWTVLSLLFVATTINYLDRGILGVILPEIREEFQISIQAYGNIQFWFQIFYGVGALICGQVLDRFGTRMGYALAAGLWSLAAMLNGFASSMIHFAVYRSVLGLGESANFPACNKAAAEWFPPSQRAAAMGMINFGTNFAQVIGPPLFIWMALSLGWQACFVIMGALGFLWLPFWLWLYRAPQQISNVQVAGSMGLREVLKYKQTWGYGWSKFLTDAPWWFYLFWLPTYLNDVRHFTPQERGTALSVIYAISGVGALVGGFASSYLMRKGWALGKARKTAMLGCALVVPVGSLGMAVENNVAAVLLFGLATAAHQAWMSNLFTAPADVFPKEAVGSANGAGVAMGAFGGALFSGLIPGYVIPAVGYVPVLLSMSTFYLIALAIIQFTYRNYEAVKLDERLAAFGLKPASEIR